jgi:hypothetical protein
MPVARPVMPTTQVRAGAEAWAIAVASTPTACNGAAAAPAAVDGQITTLVNSASTVPPIGLPAKEAKFATL